MMAESQSQAEEHSQEGPPSIPGKKKKRYDAKFKLKVVKFAERYMYKSVSW